MAESFSGSVDITTDAGERTIKIDGRYGNIRLGDNGQDGDLSLYDASGQRRFLLNANAMEFLIQASDGSTIVRLGPNGNIELGGTGADGDLLLNRNDGTRTIHADGQQGNLLLGSGGADGDILIFPDSAENQDDWDDATIHLNGNSGDIILRNADAAEDFAVADSDGAAPGVVMVVDDDGLLRPCAAAYDPRVVGVVAGAGAFRPGIVLNRGGGGRSAPISMLGKAACHADATDGPIQVGDLLTSAPRVGHAMAARDRDRAFGATIGKALTPLDAGTGLVDMLICLQ